MTYIDFHSHHTNANENEKAIVDGRDTWGIHPWTLATPSAPPTADILAIGECGLDRLCDSPYDLQQEVFLHCIRKSERLGKPLFLHCVRSIDDCLRLRKEMNAKQPWIWHGYRGNATQLRQLLPLGFYFCFGFRFNEEALAACPLDRLLLESDEDPRPISLLYTTVSQHVGCNTEQLASQMQRNFNALFGQHL